MIPKKMHFGQNEKNSTLDFLKRERSVAEEILWYGAAFLMEGIELMNTLHRKHYE